MTMPLQGETPPSAKKKVAKSAAASTRSVPATGATARNAASTRNDKNGRILLAQAGVASSSPNTITGTSPLPATGTTTGGAASSPAPETSGNASTRGDDSSATRGVPNTSGGAANASSGAELPAPNLSPILARH